MCHTYGTAVLRLALCYLYAIGLRLALGYLYATGLPLAN